MHRILDAIFREASSTVPPFLRHECYADGALTSQADGTLYVVLWPFLSLSNAVLDIFCFAQWTVTLLRDLRDYPKCPRAKPVSP